MKKLIIERIEEHKKLTCDVIESEIITQIEQVAQMVKLTLNNGNKIMFCGNGGSAADCQHLAAEFVGRFQKERRGLPAIALTVDTSILTAVGNDYGYDKVFERQIEALANPGDLLFGISTSGNSQNIINAINLAKQRGVSCVGFTAIDGGKMKDICNVCIAIPCHITARAQEMHILIGHIICELADNE